MFAATSTGTVSKVRTQVGVALTLPSKRAVIAGLFAILFLAFGGYALYINGVADSAGVTIPEAVVLVENRAAINDAAELRREADAAEAAAKAAETAAERVKSIEAAKTPATAPAAAQSPIVASPDTATFCTAQTGANGAVVRTCVDLPVDPATGLPQVTGR